MFSNFSHSLGENFLGSNEPTPPAIIIFGVINCVPLLVFTSQFSLFFFTSLSIFELNDLKNKYKDINYSSIEVDSAIQKIISFPFYLMLMTILSSTIMMNIKQNKTKVFHLIFGILISVIIYYLSFFFEELGKNEQIPIEISIWVPLIIIMLFSAISLIRINEK